jgi:hypothetical protein
MRGAINYGLVQALSEQLALPEQRRDTLVANISRRMFEA